MASYPPPTEIIPIFNPIDYNTEVNDSITIAYLNANYLKFPIAQGFETFIGTNNTLTTGCQDNIIMNTKKITGCGNPTNAQDVATKTYVDTRPAESLSATLLVGNSAGATQINMNSQKIINCLNPTDAQDVATKSYVDTNAPLASLPYIRGYMGQVSVQTGQATTPFLMSINNVFPSGTVLGFGTWQFNCQMRITTDNAYSFNCPSCVANVSFYYTAPLPVPTPVLLTSTNQAGACYYNDLAKGVAEQTSNMTFSELMTLSQEITGIYLNITAGNTTGSNHPMYIDGWWQAFKISNNY